jgi:hypothetical protein
MVVVSSFFFFLSLSEKLLTSCTFRLVAFFSLSLSLSIFIFFQHTFSFFILRVYTIPTRIPVYQFQSFIYYWNEMYYPNYHMFMMFMI